MCIQIWENLPVPSHHEKLFNLLAGFMLKHHELAPVLEYIKNTSEHTNGNPHPLAEVPTLAAPKIERAEHRPFRNGRPLIDDLILEACKTGGKVRLADVRRIGEENGYARSSGNNSILRLLKLKQIERVG